ncbi:MAG: hypothetical protein QXD43_02320 [Candidatus Aenigmatarchaeota archaeon]
MKEYFKLTTRKVLGVIILLFLFSFIKFFLQYVSNPISYVMDFSKVSLGFPLVFYSLENNLNILNLIIDIIFFYLIICFLSIVFRRKKENVPNSNSGGGNTSSSNQA